MKPGAGQGPLLPSLGNADPRERLAETIKALERENYATVAPAQGGSDQVGQQRRAWATVVGAGGPRVMGGGGMGTSRPQLLRCRRREAATRWGSRERQGATATCMGGRGRGAGPQGQGAGPHGGAWARVTACMRSDGRAWRQRHHECLPCGRDTPLGAALRPARAYSRVAVRPARGGGRREKLPGCGQAAVSRLQPPSPCMRRLTHCLIRPC